MRISNSIFYLPAIALFLFFAMLAILIRDLSLFSVSVLIWLALLYLAGTLLCKGKWFGGCVGMLPGLYMIWLSTQENGQTINIEFPMGLVLVLFYLWSMWRVKKQGTQ